ncbi:MAG TPA: site-2 protease family protein [Acidimicrobiales bacterium]|nr:site-2 protease family protein [Acidimicrobiales bacterium]
MSTWVDQRPGSTQGADDGGSAAPPPPQPGPPPGPQPPDGGRATRSSGWWALLRLAVGVAAVVALFLATGLGALLIVIVAIVVMVMVHELGHFATAKWSRMKVTEYFVGFGPRLWSVRRGGTEYGVKAIPAGGYVKIPGMSNLEEVDPADEADTYRQKPFHKRIIVASAGSVMHFVMAFLLAYGALLYFGTPTSVERVTITGFPPWSGHQQTAAQQAGLQAGDVVVAVDGHHLTTAGQFSDVVGRSAGKPVVLTVQRDGRTRQLTVTPAAGHRVGTTGEALGPATGNDGKTVGLIGVTTTVSPVFSPEGPVRAVGTAVVDIGRDTALTVRAVPQSISSLYSSITTSKGAEQSAQTGTRPESIVGAVRTATQAEQNGILDLIDILIVLNIGFALLNMLPMLPLDGGHVAIALYERIRTRRGQPYYQADVAKLLPVVYAFCAVLVVVVVSALYLDIAHPIANPFR